MNLGNNDMLDYAKDHQANILEATERDRLTKVRKTGHKRKTLLIFVPIILFLSFLVLQTLNL